MINPFDLVDLPRTLAHLREDSDVDENALEVYAVAALDHCLSYCDSPQLATVDDLPPRFKACYLLALAALWNGRDGVTKVDLKKHPLLEDMLFSMRDLRDRVPEAS